MDRILLQWIRRGVDHYPRGIDVSPAESGGHSGVDELCVCDFGGGVFDY